MITSTANAQIKSVMNLLKKSGERKRHGLFVTEGIRMFVEVPKDRLEKVYASESFASEHKALLKDYEYETVADNVFKQMSDTKTPQGILAVVRMLDYSLEDCLGKDTTPMLAVLENVQDPGNLGTIIRTAEGAGASGIIMSKDTVDIYNPKTIRSTMGSLFRMPFYCAENMIDTIDEIKKMGVKVFAAHLDGHNNYYGEDLTCPMAVLIGNEGNGLSEEITKKADCLVKIPMEGKLESLNAAVSAAVIMYEASRQRHL